MPPRRNREPVSLRPCQSSVPGGETQRLSKSRTSERRFPASAAVVRGWFYARRDESVVRTRVVRDLRRLLRKLFRRRDRRTAAQKRLAGVLTPPVRLDRSQALSVGAAARCPTQRVGSSRAATPVHEDRVSEPACLCGFNEAAAGAPNCGGEIRAAGDARRDHDDPFALIRPNRARAARRLDLPSLACHGNASSHRTDERKLRAL